MKKNGNNLKTSEYYIGLDVGTNSVGWAVTDTEYNIQRFKGKSMWGIRLFEEAQGAEGRRTARVARRRLERRNQRLSLLELIFNEAITAIDPYFFIRLKESSLVLDDKQPSAGKYSLFNDADYTDKDYLKKYPTIYHLRKDLIYSDENHDIRLVYLALHHIIKNRGHFLIDGDYSSDNSGIKESLENLTEYISAAFGISTEISNIESAEDVLKNDKLSITAKKKALRELITASKAEESLLNVQIVADSLAGATIKLSDLFNDESLKDAEIKSISLKTDIDEQFGTLQTVLGDRADLILELKKVFDTARLSQILGGAKYLSDAKVDLYKKNYDDLRKIKNYVRTNVPEKYDLIFKQKSNSKNKINNYVAYSGYKLSSGDYTCNQEDFCKFITTELPGMAEDDSCKDLFDEAKNKTLLTKLKGTDNGVIPNQLNRKELIAIIDNAQKYIPFLSEKDEMGLTVAEKIISIFDFKVPYYVGPLNNKSPNAWVVRTGDKVYPWNFNEVVDVEKSAQGFIVNLIGKCTYTGENVIPKDSLLYSKYMVLNEINLIKVNGKPIPVDVKQKLYEDMFVNFKGKVTKKKIKSYFLSLGLVEAKDEISGIDDTVKSSLKSLHDFSQILDRTKDEAMVEDIIQSILVFGEDKKMLRKWLKREYKVLTDKDIAYICKLKYKDWGRLSKEFLTGIYSPDEDGVLHSFIDMLWENNINHMQLLSSDYMFMTEAEEYRNIKFGSEQSLDEIFEDMYIAPAVRRSVRQTLRIVDELVDIKKSAPKKLFVEVAREHLEDKKRTVSRKQRLIDLYESCKEESKELLPLLQGEDENKLRSDKLFLYYMQFGKCMYSGEPIDLASLNDNTLYDIDHIFPRSRVKDDSIDNRVLVKAELNREKTNIYPIDQSVRDRMRPLWTVLKEKGFISEKKYERLVRNTPLTIKELSDFVNRQLTQTQQSAQALTTIMKKLYPQTTIVYSKAGNVSDFRQEFGFVKCRDINDLHHAKDAYLNIVVGNVYDTKFTKRFFANIANEKYSLNRVFDFDTEGAWKKNVTIDTVRKYMAKNNILFTRMPYERKGKLFNLQIRAAGEGQLPIKDGKSIEKYGGYQDISGAYFCIVEHDDKKKRIRTIEPVFIYKKALYETDPIRYCTEILGLKNPVILKDKVLFDALLLVNNQRVCITGRTGNRYVFKHSYQLVLSPEEEVLIKKISKYEQRCSSAKKELPITQFDGFDECDCINLYDTFSVKCCNTIYHSLFSSLSEDIKQCRTKFVSLKTYDKCIVLLELLKAFKCNRETTSLKLLNGKGATGIVNYSKVINNNVMLVNSSVTGLYEYSTQY